MRTLITFMHSMPARLARVFGGMWLVIYAADRSPGMAFVLAAVGTAIAVTGIADICPNGTRGQRDTRQVDTFRKTRRLTV